MNSDKKFSIGELRRLLDYDAKTGKLTWRTREISDSCASTERYAKTGIKSWNKKHANRPALNHLARDGYLTGNIKGIRVQAHRIAWAIFYGEHCGTQIDHKNRDRRDNRASNLREASPSQNGANKRVKSGATSDYMGVYRRADTGKLVAQIRVGGTNIKIGEFVEEIKAAKAYDDMAVKHHGPFAHLNRVGQ